jgi:hypothetical protein
LPNRHFYVAQALVPAASALLPTPAFDAMSQPRTGVLVCLGNEIATALVGRTPWSAADAPVGLLAPCKMLTPLCRLRDEGVPRGPGGPPHHECTRPTSEGNLVALGTRACATWERVRNGS